MAIFFSILIFSFLIFIHEFGHFIAAKLSGVQVNEFSMFMGPTIVKWKRGDTLYSIRCIPIGGYCAMEGEDEDSDNPHSVLGTPGKTDLLVTWLFKMITASEPAAYNLASVIGILVFVVVAFISLVVYNVMPSIKNEEEFQ